MSLSGNAVRSPIQDGSAAPLSDGDLDAALHRPERVAEPAPELDGHGRLLYRGRWVGLSLVQERLVELLVQHYGDVVRYSELQHHAWPGSDPTMSSLRTMTRRLRTRISPLGLEILTLQSLGYLLQTKDTRADGIATTAPGE
jgi:hypothetical protein